MLSYAGGDSMTKVEILGSEGHQTFEDLTPEQAEELINKTIEAEGQRYFIIDKQTKAILKEIKLSENQEIALIPIARGG